MAQRRGICKYPFTVHADPERLADIVAERFIALSTQAISQRDAFHVALAGGSTPRRLYQALAKTTRQSRIDWQRIHIYFGDERAVPPEHADSNFRMAREALLDAVALPSQNIHPMLANPSHIQQDADRYAALLASQLPQNDAHWPVFDLILLGLGTDGHTCSLFPDTPILMERQRAVAAVEVKHLNSWRLSLTFPVLDAARQLLFLVAGQDKAPILQRLCDGPGDDTDSLPVERIEPTGQVEWHLDQAAAAALEK